VLTLAEDDVGVDMLGLEWRLFEACLLVAFDVNSENDETMMNV
jgi:hypothetical protein